MVKLHSFLSFSRKFFNKRLANEISKSVKAEGPFTRRNFNRTVMAMRQIETVTAGVFQ